MGGGPSEANYRTDAIYGLNRLYRLQGKTDKKSVRQLITWCRNYDEYSPELFNSSPVEKRAAEFLAAMGKSSVREIVKAIKDDADHAHWLIYSLARNPHGEALSALESLLIDVPEATLVQVVDAIRYGSADNEATLARLSDLRDGKVGELAKQPGWNRVAIKALANWPRPKPSTLPKTISPE